MTERRKTSQQQRRRPGKPPGGGNENGMLEPTKKGSRVSEPTNWSKFPRLALLPAAALGLMLVFVGAAQAEPYLSVREGYKCSKCHVNKTGGGKRTGYAQVYIHSRLGGNNPSQATGEKGGAEANFPNGDLSDFISIGADVRTGTTWTYPSDGSDPHQEFNRPAACTSCHQSTEGGGKIAEVYYQLKAVPDRASVVLSQSLMPRGASREAYTLIEALPLTGYVKAGTFRLPNALENPFDDPFVYHTSITSHPTAGIIGVETVRATGVEVGVEPGPFSVSLSLTNPSDPSSVPRAKRTVLTGYAINDWGMFGLTYASDPLTLTSTRTTTGGYLGTAVGRFTALFQMDLVKTEDASDDSETRQRVGITELHYLFAKGIDLKLLYEFVDPDMDAGGDLVDRTSLIYEQFLAPYLRVRGGYRDYTGPEDDASVNFLTYFAELHFIF